MVLLQISPHLFANPKKCKFVNQFFFRTVKGPTFLASKNKDYSSGGKSSKKVVRNPIYGKNYQLVNTWFLNAYSIGAVYSFVSTKLRCRYRYQWADSNTMPYYPSLRGAEDADKALDLMKYFWNFYSFVWSNWLNAYSSQVGERSVDGLVAIARWLSEQCCQMALMFEME